MNFYKAILHSSTVTEFMHPLVSKRREAASATAVVHKLWLILLLALLVSLLAIGANVTRVNAATAAEGAPDGTMSGHNTMPYGSNGGLVASDRVVVYTLPSQDNQKTATNNELPPSFGISIGCSEPDNNFKTVGGAAKCTTVGFTLEQNSASSSLVTTYRIVPDDPNATISASIYAEIIATAESQLASNFQQPNSCAAPAHLVVAGNSWASGGNSWASGGNSWASGGNSWASGTDGSIITYEDAYPEQWSLDMLEKSANLYGQGEGVTIAFIDVFKEGPAIEAGLHISASASIELAEVLDPELDLSLHGNVVHSVFNSIAPNTTVPGMSGVNAIGIPVFNQNGMAVNAGVVRGVELALERLPDNSIINMSFGTSEDNLDGCTTQALESLFDQAQSRNIALVASSGNARQEPAEYPALSDKVHGVEAVGPDRSRALYSNVGDILAPGGTRDAPLIVRVPFPIEGTRPVLPNIDISVTNDPLRYATATGTSFAAPYVSATIANLLADGVPAGEIETTLDQITDSNCGIVALNPFYALECLKYQEVTRADYGVQRLPHPNYGTNPRSWNTEPYWIGSPPCELNDEGVEVCDVAINTVASPYIYADDGRTIGSKFYSNAQDAYDAYEFDNATDMADYGIQIVTRSDRSIVGTERPVWLDVPEVCDEFGEMGANFDADACDLIRTLSPGIWAADFYYHGQRPAKPDMIILDNHSCAGFDGRVFDTANQAACIYRTTAAAMMQIAPDDSSGPKSIDLAMIEISANLDEASPFDPTRPQSQTPGKTPKVNAADQSGAPNFQINATVYLPTMAQP